ncbi:hypothetical protein GCM10009416_49180 [Craurococcus roseus]|uniref:histidine kinase n=1 Tax=Craurococcus roseus TaxID=77585 RepID=A0ABN1G822_9PROT
MGSNNRNGRRRFGRGGAGVLGAAALAAVLLAGGGAALNDRISAELLRQDAEAEALSWAADLSTNLPDLSALVERRAPSPEALTRLAMARKVGGVFRYKIFDGRGDLVFVSDDLDRIAPEDMERDLASHRGSSPVAKRLLAGGTHVEAARGAPPHRPAYYAEAYVPVLRDGAVLGVVEVYVDQTAQRARYEAAFVRVEGFTAALILLAGLLPLGLVLRQTRKRREAEALQALLAREADHRAKNVFAVVQSVLRLTPKGDAAAYALAVEGRVAALARAHALLADGAWAGADLRTVAERELAPYAGGGLSADGSAAASLEGPPVPLAAAAVQPLAVVLHELATNAAKYGALSRPEGRVRLSWRVDEDAGLLVLRWAESGGPAISGPPARRGFGSKVIDATARGQLGGTVAFGWGVEGLRADIAFPLGRALAAAAPHAAKAPAPPSAPSQDSAPHAPLPHDPPSPLPAQPPSAWPDPSPRRPAATATAAVPEAVA